MNRYDGFAEFARTRGAAMSRTAYLLAGDAERAARLLAAALRSVARDWPRVSAHGDPEATVRAQMARRSIRLLPHRDELADLTGRARAIAVLRDYHQHSEPEIAAMLECSHATVLRCAPPEAIPSGLLDLLASQAGNYANAGAAVAEVRRNQRRRALISLIVLALAAGGVVAAITSGHLSGSPDPTGSKAADLVLPARVVVPAGDVAVLPSDHGIGPALLVYRACPSTCAAYLLTQDGRQFRLPLDRVSARCCPDLTTAATDLPVSLSPDGRWLATATGRGVAVRDLTGTGVRAADVNFITAWSPDGRFVIGPTAGGVRKVDLWTGASELVDGRARGITNGGRVQSAFPSLTETSISIQITDPDGSAAITGDRMLRRAESLWLPTPNGNRAEVRFGAGGWYAATVFGLTARQRTAVLLGNYTDGSLGARAEMPRGAGPPFFFGAEAVFADQVAPSDPIAIVGIAPGGTVSLSQLPAHAEFVIAGQGGALAGPAQPIG